MKSNFYYKASAFLLMATVLFTGCKEENGFKEKGTTCEINFTDVPAVFTASDKYGTNLYSGSKDQITSGYMQQIGTTGTYVQFPINYSPQMWEPNTPWRYEYHNGGIAVSNFTDITIGDYTNQCSVYNGGKAGIDNDKFIVAFGYCDPKTDATYSKCAKIYLTDENGYKVSTPNQPVTGVAKTGKINSLWVCNTTYTHTVINEGNTFSADNRPLKDQNGWFKVVFIGFDDKDQITGQVDYYLANFDSKQPTELNGILKGWHQVKLDKLGDNVAKLIINLEGSDVGNYGLNTPGYVAIDDINITVK